MERCTERYNEKESTQNRWMERLSEERNDTRDVKGAK